MNLSALATAKRLLIVSDFDGTLAGFSQNAYDVPTNKRSLAALEKLSQSPHTTIAILTGRHLDGLAQVAQFPAHYLLVGSHGAEEANELATLTTEQQQGLTAIGNAFSQLLIEGAFVEEKPYHRVLHAVRAKDQQLAANMLEKALTLDLPAGITLKPGRMIIEASATDATKGTWIEKKKKDFDAIVFLGDDTTDEDGFAVLNRELDLGVKVGDGETLAGHRVADLDGVADFLEELATLRTAQH
ncbi:Trehalose-phosphate phosphatase [Corynebacterium kutscheri]|uniref:Trehalose 6-phosphate phosphatase n=1 Tax=Corynebacterium kutscheri TaxID=35755 RepID=A0A0F6R113_9CORY|nr:trehalose-phosphatase [Corynebacterium kutscheri]AKE40763.1 trehalose-phosphatase [Corynebacterium kutscheri]VEH04548.1 Trehalose-phosphate phosphatase [Corynebacterium kutscheri]VEH11161.1 Trehalose-phosphate phosphatase [Corynebacterium kutscheri]VEH80362.1 Trehalose-phosphate phosphatase [Corynebacterium kutscheri]